MIVLIYFFIVLLSLMTLHVASRCTKFAKLINKVPGPIPLPFIGNGLMFNVSPEMLWELLLHLLDDYYPILRVWIFNIAIVIICDPDDMRKVLTCKKNIEKCKRLVYNGFTAVGNDGIIASGGEKWPQRRTLITPAFSPSMLKVYVQIINEHTEQLIINLKHSKPETELDLVPIFKKITLGIICEAAIGVNTGSFGVKGEEKFRYNFNETIEVLFYRATRPYVQDWMMKFLSVGRKLERALPSFRKFSKTIIKERRDYRAMYPKLQNISDEIDGVKELSNKRKKLALIDLLLEAESEGLIDEQGIIEEVETIIAAGSDTSGVSITFALMLLAENKAEQDIARAEITHLLEKTGGELKMEDINSLKYFDRCIKEVLRLYPSGPLIGRHITDEIELSNYKIPKGTEVVMNIFHLHQNPNYWPDPEKFSPDRFLPENTKGRHPFAYLPFSWGLRSCVGYKFALLEIKIIVARILYNFHIVPVDLHANVKFKASVSLHPIDPCRVKLVYIDRQSSV